MPDKPASSVGEQVITGSLWLGSWRWTARLIGFGTTIVLARLLVPEDFGILATGAIVTGFIGIMTRLGTDAYLIRHLNPSREDYDTAWTLRFIVISLSSVAIFLMAKPGADYFNDPRIAEVLQFLALVSWLGGLTNIGLTIYRRELQFRIIAMIGLSQRIAAAATTIGLAFWLRNYWAMVIGEVVFGLVGLVLSYTHHTYRPRFTLVRIREQWEFCKWVVLQNLASFIQSQGGSFVVVKFFSIELLGLFSMAGRVAALPTQQVIAPVLAPVYSGLAKKQADPAEFATSVMKLVGSTAILMLPAATLFASLSEQIVVVVLGERWVGAIPIIAPLTLSIMLGVLAGPMGFVLTIKGKMKLLTFLNWFSTIAGVLIIFFVAFWQDIELLVWTQVAVALAMLLVFFGFMLAVIEVSVITLVKTIYRPLVASLIMASAIYLISISINPAWLVLLVGVMAGGTSYLLASILLWKLAGSPEASESFLVRKVVNLIARNLKK